MQHTPDELVVMDDQRFRKVVNDDIRDGHNFDGLSDKKVVRRWYSTLHLMLSDVQNQLLCREAEYFSLRASLNQKLFIARNFNHENEVTQYQIKLLEAEEEYFSAKGKSCRFLTGVEKRFIVATYYKELVYEEKDFLLKELALESVRVGQLEEAIKSHKTQIKNASLYLMGKYSSIEIADINETLWNALPKEHI